MARRHRRTGLDQTATQALRDLILACERYRQVGSDVLGLSVSETQTLSFLKIVGESSQRDLATHLGFSTGAVTALVDRLEIAEMVQRFPDSSDRRKVAVRVTAKALTVLDASDARLLAAFLDLPGGSDHAVEFISRLTLNLGEQIKDFGHQDPPH